MSSYQYSAPPRTPTASSFFPTGPSAPHAFSSMHQSPRDQVSMFSVLSPSSQQSSGGQKSGGLSGMKFLGKK